MPKNSIRFLQPQHIYMYVQYERSMMSKTRVMIMFPAVVDSDVDFRELTILVKGDAEGAVKKFQPEEPSSQFVVPTGTEVTVSLVDVDRSGNRSLPRVQEILALVPDVTPPHLPGELGVTMTEIPDDEE